MAQLHPVGLWLQGENMAEMLRGRNTARARVVLPEGEWVVSPCTNAYLLHCACNMPGWDILYHLGEAYFVRPYYPGPTLLASFENAQAQGDFSAASQLLLDGWQSLLEALHDLGGEGRCLCHGDANLRNAIMTRAGVRWIDWDTLAPGEPAEDAADYMAFIMLYAPAFSSCKLACCRELFPRLCADAALPEEDMASRVGRNMERLLERRVKKGPLTPAQARELLRKWEDTPWI